MHFTNFVWYFLGNTVQTILPFRAYGYWSKGLKVVDAETRLTIEGFPRSGNTFLFSLVSQMVDERKIAHHLHTVCHLQESVKLNVPTIFISRQPSEAIASYVIREGISISRALNHYLQLYRFVSAHRDRLLIIDFRDVIERSPALYSVLNKALHDDYSWSRITSNQIMDKVELLDKRNSGGLIDERKVGRPSISREGKKLETIKLIRKNFAKQLSECEQLYFTCK